MRVWTIVILNLFVLLASAQKTATISIQSYENFIPLTGVRVYSETLDTVLYSDENGKVFLPIHERKKQLLTFFFNGYEEKEAIVHFLGISNYSVFLTPLHVEIDQITIQQEQASIHALQLRSVEDMSIYAAKKTELIELNSSSANLSTNNSRQIYARVPGLNIWESHGSGLATEIGGRGLSPIRSSNFNIRQNGYDISADALGYPDAYYIPPAEAIDRIEIVRGAASLQYGTQFGGMMNYKMKSPASNSPFHIELRQTTGAYRFSNTFAAIGGSHKSTHYYNAFQYKRGNGWRENSAFHSFFNYTHLDFDITNKLKLSVEYTYFSYLAQQAGGLTDVLFKQDPQQSIRNRNWFSVNWHLPQIEWTYEIGNRTKIQSKSFFLYANRNAVGFLGNITRTDPLDNRDLLKDFYKNIGNETRIMHKYYMREHISVFLAGIRLYKGHTTKKQGETDSGDGASFDYLNPENLENSDYQFPNRNIALFAENIFHITKGFSITPGIRFENISTKASGYYHETTSDLAGNILLDTIINDSNTKKRSFILLGIGLSYKSGSSIEWYANFSQNYRAVNFNDLRIVNPNFKVDPNLEDEKGFNADIGIRGVIKNILAYDLSLFYLNYDNRIGFILQSDTVLFQTYRLRTNVSQSRSVGIEFASEVDWLRITKKCSNHFSLKTFFNFSYIDGRYISSDEPAFHKKRVELVPNVLFKSGLTFGWKTFSLTYQYSYTGEQYTDASNARFSADAVHGMIPAYYSMDISTSYQYKYFRIEAHINNLTNNMYFTRRAVGYPGPGIIPSDGITYYVTLGFEFQK